MRVVLDTNVLVSALLYPGGPPESVVRLALEERLEFVTSHVLLDEFNRVLTRKLGWDVSRAGAVIRPLLEVAIIVNPIEQVADITADAADNRVLEAAATGAADVMVSGDRHLLALGSWRGIRIASPAAFLAEWK